MVNRQTATSAEGRTATPEARGFTPARAARHEARASTTYKSFLRELQKEGFASENDATRAAAAVLCTLEQRLNPNDARKLESQLPSKLGELLARCEQHAELRPREIDRDVFLAMVEDHLADAPRAESDPERITRAVLSAIARHVTAGQAQKVIHELPPSLRELWPDWARAGIEPGAALEAAPEGEASAASLAEQLSRLPISEQVAALRTMVPRVLSQLAPPEREAFLCEVSEPVGRS